MQSVCLHVACYIVLLRTYRLIFRNFVYELTDLLFYVVHENHEYNNIIFLYF